MNAIADSTQTLRHRDRWLVSYADLMTLLFALFVVLFAAAYRKGACGLPRLAASAHKPLNRLKPPAPSANTQAATANPTTPTTGRQQLYAQLQHSLNLPLSTNNLSLTMRPEGIVISMKEAGYFGTGQAMPLPAADEILDRISQVVGPTGVPMRVEGHTDDQPINTPRFHSNWELSTARAESVLQMLLAESAIDPGRLSVAGYGAYRPIADNGTDAGRRANRRVDLILLMP